MACNSPSYSYCTNCGISCDSCEGCNKCQKCDTGCQSSCLTEQTYNGKKISELFSTFNFSPTPVAGVTIIGPDSGMFNKASWDALATWISQRHELTVDELKADSDGCYDWIKEHNADGGSVVSSSSVNDVKPFKASEFNRVSSEVDGPTATGAYSTADANGVGDLITADIFTRLVSAANSKTVDDGACQHCNTSCDLTCNSCQKCNSGCNATCNSCQATCNACQYCEGCDSCNSCNACNISCNTGEESEES